jgi:hypothetical protein
MATPQDNLNLSGAEPLPQPRVRTPRAPAPAAPAAPLSVDPRLDSFVKEVIGEASKRTGYTYKLGEGVRTPEQQAGKVARGVSWTLDSPHMHGRGRDVLAFDRQGNYITDGAHEAYKALGDVYSERASAGPVPVRWGVVKDGRQIDPGHFQIEDGAAPALNLDGAEPINLDGAEPLDTPAPSSSADDYGEPVTVNSSVDRASGLPLSFSEDGKPAAPVATEPPASPSAPLNLQTEAGRVARDTSRSLAHKSGSFVPVAVPLSRDEEVNPGSLPAGDAVRRGVHTWAESNGVPGWFVDKWMSANAPTGYSLHVHAPGGDAASTLIDSGAPYDEAHHSYVVEIDAQHLSKLKDDYEASKGTLQRAGDFVSSDEESPGEKVLDVAAPVAGVVAKGAGYAGRPFHAIGAGVFAAGRGQNPLTEAAHVITTGEHTQAGSNPVGNALRDSTTLAGINPRLPRLLGGVADTVLDPANLVGLGLAGKGARALAGAGRLAEGAESVGLLGRGMVEARPLGLLEEGGEAAAAARGVEAAAPVEIGAQASYTTPQGMTHKGVVEALSEKDAARVTARGSDPASFVRLRTPDGGYLIAQRDALAHSSAAAVPVPESPETLAAQFRSAANPESPRAAVLVTPGEAPRQAPKGFAVFNMGDDGTLYLHKGKAKSLGITSGSKLNQYVLDNGFEPLIGKVAPVADTSTGVALRTEDAAGRELSTSVVPTEDAARAQAAVDLAQFPEAAKQELGTAQEMVARRQQGSGDTVNDALLDHTRERADFYDAQAAQLTDRAARANARELAASYRAEVARLEAGDAAAPEGFDVAAGQSSTTPSTIQTAPPRSLLSRAARTVADVAQLPKAKAGFDLSATGRQALPQILAHPSYFKDAMVEQLKAFGSEDAFNNFVGSIKGRPDFDVMRESGLYLSSAGSGPEEAFASRLVKRIPGVRGSERAYSAALDSVRVQAWDNYMGAVADNPHAGPETYKAIADLVNISTGRGVVPILDRSAWGKQFINALNVPLFSPRNMAAKFNLISPARIIRNAVDPATRPVAWLQARDAMRGLGTLGTTIGLAHVAGLDVGVNPFSNDFGKLRVGNAVYDLTGGEGASVRYMAQMAQSFRTIEQGKKLDKRQTPLNLTRRYLRSQLQPAASAAVDLYTGEDFTGKPVTRGGVAADLVIPFVADDLYRGWLDAGGSSVSDVQQGKPFNSAVGGAARGLPGVLGVGTAFYPKKGDDGGEGAPVPLDSAAPDPIGHLFDQPQHEGVRESVVRGRRDAEPTFRPFPDSLGSLDVPRASMPQVRSAHRGAMVQFLKGRGISHSREEIAPNMLKPSQAEYSPEKVAKARTFEGPSRAILVSQDNHVADGHHQWLAALHDAPTKPVPVIRLNAPIQQLLLEMARFPSSDVSEASK